MKRILQKSLAGISLKLQFGKNNKASNYFNLTKVFLFLEQIQIIEKLFVYRNSNILVFNSTTCIFFLLRQA